MESSSLRIYKKLQNEMRELHEALVVEREQKIAELETSLLELNELMQNVSMIVKVQGASINNIESHVTHAKGNVEGAKESLQSTLKKM